MPPLCPPPMPDQMRECCFEVSTQSALLDRAVEKVGVVLGGGVVTHPPLPHTEAFLVALLLQKASFLAAAGYFEKGIFLSSIFKRSLRMVCVLLRAGLLASRS